MLTPVVHSHELPVGAFLPCNITYQAHETPLAGVVATDSADSTRGWIERLFASVSYRMAPLQRAVAEAP